MEEKYTISFPVGDLIKGFALLLMVFHHCYGFPLWLDSETLRPTCMEFCQRWAFSANICVSIFAFLTGWFYFHHRDKSSGYSLKKMGSCIVEYGVLVVFTMSVATIFCGYTPRMSGFVLELFPLGSFHKLMIFAWYIRFYLIVLLLLPFLAAMMDVKGKRCRFVVVLVGLVVLYIMLFFSGHANDTCWLPCVISGYACAQYSVLERLARMLAFLKSDIIAGIFAVVTPCCLYRYCWNEVLGRFDAGFLYAPIFCSGCILLYPYVKKIKVAGFIQLLGKHSLNVWILHGIFFSTITKGVFQKFAYAIDSPAYVIPFVVGCSLLVSMVLKPIQVICRKLLIQKLAGM